MKLFLIRHGQSEANANHQYSGQFDTKLTELGRQQAMALVPILSDMTFDKVYSSDLSRAVITQQLALPGITGRQIPLLREYDIGSLACMNIAEAVEKYGPNNGDFIPFGGENTEMVIERVRDFLAILECDPVDRVAAFTHGGFINCMLRLIMGGGNPARVDNGNCNIAVFEYRDQTWHLLCWNYGKKL